MNIKITKNDGAVEEMGVEEFSRWMCLMEAYYFIEEKGRTMGIEVPYDTIKPALIDDYIKRRYNGMLHDVTCEAKLGHL